MNSRLLNGNASIFLRNHIYMYLAPPTHPHPPHPHPPQLPLPCPLPWYPAVSGRCIHGGRKGYLPLWSRAASKYAAALLGSCLSGPHCGWNQTFSAKCGVPVVVT